MQPVGMVATISRGNLGFFFLKSWCSRISDTESYLFFIDDTSCEHMFKRITSLSDYLNYSLISDFNASELKLSKLSFSNILLRATLEVVGKFAELCQEF